MEKKKKDPAFLMYPKEFLADTAFLTNEQVGIYIKMLCYQHHKGHLSEKEIGKITGGEPDEEVMAMFACDENGLWYSPKLEDEISRRKRYAEEQSERAKKRWNNKDATAYALADALSMPRDVTETVTGTGTGTGTGDYSIETIEGKQEETNPELNTQYDTLQDLYKEIYE